MKKENRWAHEEGYFVFPALPPEVRGRHGRALHRLTFDEKIGEEICVVYLEQPEFVDKFSNIVPFNLIAHPGLARTPYGVVAFIVWQIAAHSAHEVMIEQILNPHNMGAIRIVASAANQTHFKLLVINNQ